MLRQVLAPVLALFLLTACLAREAVSVPAPPPVAASPALPFTETPATGPAPAAAADPPPSDRVAAFYYPWYGTPDRDGEWIHWTQNQHVPPADLASDYFPALGAYSSSDPAVLAQHMQWLGQAGIGVLISSWWGQGSREDRVVPLLLEAAQQHGIRVAFHIEPYRGRTAESLTADVSYLYEQYGRSPAFFRSTATSRYSQDPQLRGMFFVWSIATTGGGGERVGADYWRPAMDAIHSHPEGALIIANTTDGAWVTDGHFDGLYNYATLHLEEQGGFDWARSLPPESLYVPSVIPGFSARRIAYPETTYVPRNNGTTFEQQWNAALSTGVEPAMVTITSFNEWHEGSIIEPPLPGADDGQGYRYADFESLPPDGYLDLTRQWVSSYLARSWSAAQRARIEIETTSDWTTLDAVSGGAWIRTELIAASASAVTAGMEAGDRLVLTQSLDDARLGKQVAMTWDVWLIDLVPGEDIVLQVDRGNLGTTIVTISTFAGAVPREVKRLEWGQVTTGRNSHLIEIPAALFEPAGAP